MSASAKLQIGQIIGVIFGIFGATGYLPVANANEVTSWIVEIVTGSMALLSLISFLEHQFHLVKTGDTTSTTSTVAVTGQTGEQSIVTGSTTQTGSQ